MASRKPHKKAKYLKQRVCNRYLSGAAYGMMNKLGRLAESLTQLSKVASCSVRHMSAASGKLTSLDVNDKTGIATLTLNRPPVNGLNLDLLKEMHDALDQVENNRSKGLILTSNLKTIFSGGLDIMEMYKPDQERLKQFWTTLQDTWLKLYSSPYATAAAINGHSPAGGCLLAMSCEYRVMCPNYTIGLNETQLGIVAPAWFQSTMRNVLPTRVAESALTLGKMFSTEESLNIGLVDEIANDKAEALQKCEAFLLKFKKISPDARALTKQIFRGRDINDFEKNREKDLQLFIFAINQPKVQKGLEIYLESLKKKQ